MKTPMIMMVMGVDSKSRAGCLSLDKSPPSNPVSLQEAGSKVRAEWRYVMQDPGALTYS